MATVRQTKFSSGGTIVAFGILWPEGAAFITDWQRESRYVVLPGVGVTETQLFGMGPRTVTHRLFFETADDFRDLDALVQQSGTLTVFHKVHTAPVADADIHAIHGKQYADVDCVLLSLVSAGVTTNGFVEADATFQATS